ncbi:hypothetical protein CkaCkLH20_11083 [Colletotrichum karsti]|uniref:DUF6604 domain-containing protein n=1 Tax=Colletotrichum karsti TaxID=1095194 RepID=A0A9P6HYH5_9PEZI|nr:uncharacterized protein CkaCkLH20_11083 [Colletotrichum karsti]KAF9871436.1 hypothetical protein CkaCkLH20_11083 [Colletotrichum karsti]
MASSKASSISSLYESYKASTNCFLRWLWCQQRLHSPRGTAVTFKSTKDILESAKLLEKKKTAVPSSVLGFLRDAITKRLKVFEIYKELHLADAGHQVFVQRLEKTLNILLPLAGKSRTSVSDEASSILLNAPNQFSSLAVTVETIEDEDIGTNAHSGHAHGASSSCVSPSEDSDHVASEAPRDFVLEDDQMRDHMDAIYYLIELTNVHDVLKESWAEAAEGKIPLSLAAWLTNMAAYTITSNMPTGFFSLCSHLFTKCGTPNCAGIGAFVTKLVKDDDDPELPARHGDNLYKLAKSINEYGTSLGSFVGPKVEGRSDICIGTGCKCNFRTDLVRDLIPCKTTSSLPDDENHKLVQMLDSVRGALLGTRAISQIEPLKHNPELDFPIISEAFVFFAQIFFQREIRIAHAGLVFSANLLFMTNEQALINEKRLSGSKCRLQCLRLAQEIRTDVLPVIGLINQVDPTELRWKQRAPELQNFVDGLDEYLRDKSFDIYHTSPWTTGNHMTELLTGAALTGRNACWDWAIITSTLHLYNALRRSKLDVQEIPLLEQLAQVLIHDTFRGVIPERNFVSLYRRVVYDCKIARVRDGSVSRLEVGFTKSTPVRGHILTWFVEQHCNNHDAAAVDWLDVVHGVATYTRRPCICCKRDHKKDIKINEIHKEVAPSEYLERAKATVLPELMGTKYPLARLNFFKLFMFCGKIMKAFGVDAQSRLAKLGKKANNSLEGDILSHPLTVARCVTEFALEDLDEHAVSSGSRQRRRLLQRCSTVTAAIKVFQEKADREATLDQFLWDI